MYLKQIVVVVAACCLMTSGAFAQQDKHTSGKISPQELSRFHAEYARYAKENGIDDSRVPSATNYRLEKPAENVRLLSILEAISNNQAIFDQLELVDDQEQDVKRILEQYQGLNEDLARKAEGASDETRSFYEGQYRQECRKLTSELSEVLVSFQSMELLDSAIGSGGLLEMLTKPTLASKYVDLSDAQKRRLKEKQEELGREIQEFIQQKRKDASAIFEEELNGEQKQRLVEFFGADRVSQSFETASSESLIRQSGLELKPEEFFGPKIKEWQKVEKKIRDN